MILPFVHKEADKAYVSNHLWLPKDSRVQGGVRLDPVKKALEFLVPGRGEQQLIKMWEESWNHIICPREFLPSTQYPTYKFPFIDICPPFSKAEFEDLVVPRTSEQETAWQALALNNNGILNLGCGKGKTKLALKKIAQMGVPTLVIVPDGGMLEQWKQSIHGSDRTPPGLHYEGELGIIQGSSFDWRRSLTLALVSTLALRIRDGAVPEELFKHYGLIVYDEVHQVGAPVFSQTAWPFYGNRIGLTATVSREDGLDPVYRYHIGEPFYSDLKQDLIPYVYFQKTPMTMDYSSAEDKKGNTNVSILRTLLGNNLEGNTFRYWAIKGALDQGRKILCLSHSKDQLRLFHAMFPGSGLIISETERSERLAVLRNSQLCFAISKLGSVGVDDDRLDALFWMTPFRSLVSLQQSIGRIQRALEGKKHPYVVIFEDFEIPTLKRMCQNLKSTFNKWQFKFEVHLPPGFPRNLPPEVQTLYDRANQQLADRN